MSLQTTLARAQARDADSTWQRHRKLCVVCMPAARRRRWDQLCPEGSGILRTRDELRATAEHEASLDRQPAPGQHALF